MFRFVGIDENGLGPRLGPLVVTAAELRAESAERLRDGCARAGIDDSKRLCAHGDMRRVEGLVLALLDEHLGLRPADVDALWEALAWPSAASLRSHCPAGEAPRACHGSPLPLPAFGGDPSAARGVARALKDQGVTLAAARSALVCARVLREMSAKGFSRFDVDLDRMIELLGALRDAEADEVVAVCGRVGGRADYRAALRARWALAVEDERSKTASRYRVPGVGRVAWIVDADASDPAVSLASLVGKYVRELSVERMFRYYRESVEGLARASGYHDPVTERFVQATALVRRDRGIDDSCFAR